MNKKIVSKILVLFLLGCGVFVATDTQPVQASACDVAMFAAVSACDSQYEDISAYVSCLDAAYDTCAPTLDFCPMAEQRFMECAQFESLETWQAFMACRNHSGIDQCE